MIQCPWCDSWQIKNLSMRIQFCHECSDAWDPIECNDGTGKAVNRPAGPEETANGASRH